MVTRAPTYTFSSSNPALFRKKGKSLSDKLTSEFRAIECFAASSMQVSAATVFGGGKYATVTYWTNPIAPSPIIIDHIIIRVGTGSGVSGTRLNLGWATLTGLAQNTCAVANRAVANTYGGASRTNLIHAFPVTNATFINTQHATSCNRAGTILEGKFQYLSGRAVGGNAGALAGTMYVFWYKAFPGAA